MPNGEVLNVSRNADSDADWTFLNWLYALSLVAYDLCILCTGTYKKMYQAPLVTRGSLTCILYKDMRRSIILSNELVSSLYLLTLAPT